MLKSQAMAKQSNSEAIVDNSSVKSSAKAGEYFGGLQTISKMRQATFTQYPDIQKTSSSQLIFAYIDRQL